MAHAPFVLITGGIESFSRFLFCITGTMTGPGIQTTTTTATPTASNQALPTPSAMSDSIAAITAKYFSLLTRAVMVPQTTPVVVGTVYIVHFQVVR